MKTTAFKLFLIIPLFSLIAQSNYKSTTNSDYDRGSFGVTYTGQTDLGIVVEIDFFERYVFGMGFVMNLDSYKGIGEKLNNGSVTAIGKLTSEPEYKKMSIIFDGGFQLNKSIALIGGLGYTHKTEYYRLNTDEGFSKAAYHYHVETGNVYGELYAGIKARVLLGKQIAVSSGYGTNGLDFGLYYVFY